MCSGQELDMFHLFTYSEVLPFSADGCDKIMNDMNTHTNIKNTTAHRQQVFFSLWGMAQGLLDFSDRTRGPLKWVRLTVPAI